MPTNKETQATVRHKDTGSLKEVLGRIPALPTTI